MSIYIEIFLIGLLGSMHCIGMCGGFVAMYTLRGPGMGSPLLVHVLYNLGRMTTYSLLGGILGAIGSFSVYLLSYRSLPGTVLLLAGIIMVLMGLSMTGIVLKKGLFETDRVIGSQLFRRALNRTLGMRTPGGVYLFGLMLGLLPCGLLYPVLMHAAVSGGFYSGFISLTVFGLGTVPALMAFGAVMTQLKPRLRLSLHRIAGALIVLLGIQTLLRGMAFLSWIRPSRFW